MAAELQSLSDDELAKRLKALPKGNSFAYAGGTTSSTTTSSSSGFYMVMTSIAGSGFGGTGRSVGQLAKPAPQKITTMLLRHLTRYLKP